MASVFMCKTSSVNHTVVLYCTELCVSPLNFPTYQSAVAKERPGGPVVLRHVAVISGVHIRPVTFLSYVIMWNNRSFTATVNHLMKNKRNRRVELC